MFCLKQEGCIKKEQREWLKDERAHVGLNALNFTVLSVLENMDLHLLFIPIFILENINAFNQPFTLKFNGSLSRQQVSLFQCMFTLFIELCYFVLEKSSLFNVPNI